MTISEKALTDMLRVQDLRNKRQNSKISKTLFTQKHIIFTADTCEARYNTQWDQKAEHKTPASPHPHHFVFEGKWAILSVGSKDKGSQGLQIGHLIEYYEFFFRLFKCLNSKTLYFYPILNGQIIS